MQYKNSDGVLDKYLDRDVIVMKPKDKTKLQ